jgi:hypothetical protein
MNSTLWKLCGLTTFGMATVNLVACLQNPPINYWELANGIIVFLVSICLFTMNSTLWKLCGLAAFGMATVNLVACLQNPPINYLELAIKIIVFLASSLFFLV